MLIAGAVVASTPRLHAEPQLVNGIDAVVHDSAVTFSEVQERTQPAEALLYRQYRDQPLVFRKKLADARNENLEQLVQRQLILRDFKLTITQPEQQAMVDKMINKDIDQEIEAEIHARYGGNRMSFIQTLQADGITLERRRQQIRDRLLVSWLRQKNITSEIIVSPHRVEAYYLSHREQFKVKDEVKVRMIVLKCPGENEAPRTRKLAEDILTKLKEGATFAEMATIHSDGSQRNQGGDLGWLELSSLSQGLADTASSLQAGQRSGVLSRSGGYDYWICQYDKGVPSLGRHYVADTASKTETMIEERRFENASVPTNLPPPVEFYLMLVEDKRPARFKPLVEVREQIEKDMKTEEQTRLEKQWIDKLKKKTFVRVF
jgi:peptidyl-prolyl cis-trans isomerase SurA